MAGASPFGNFLPVQAIRHTAPADPVASVGAVQALIVYPDGVPIWELVPIWEQEVSWELWGLMKDDSGRTLDVHYVHRPCGQHAAIGTTHRERR